MTKNYYILLIFICFSLLNSNTLRNLNTIISVESTENFVYDSETNTVTFQVNVKDDITAGNSYTITFKFKSTEIQTANCVVADESPKKLTCSFTSEKPYYGSIILVGSSYPNNEASIQLNSEEEQTIFPNSYITLEFIKAYDLSYSSSTSTFKIEIQSSKTLDNEPYYLVDITKDENAEVAECTLNEKVLTCTYDGDLTSLYKISKTKANGSITWSNSASIDVNILLAQPLNVYTNGYGFNANFDSSKWTFFYNFQIDYAQGYYFELNTILDKKGGSKVVTTSKCSTNKNYNHLCTIEADTQEATDLFYICTSIADGDNTCNDKKDISRVATLTFKNAYELEYTSSQWNFKIEVDEESNRDGMNVTVGLEKKEGGFFTASCTYTVKILSCVLDSTNANEDDLYYLIFDNQYGSVTWADSSHEKTKIPLVASLDYVSSYDLLYENSKWTFKLKVKLQAKIPKDSLISIDILNGADESSASCEGNTEGNANAETVFTCESDLSEDANLTINKNKRLGSVTWSSGITDDSASIEKKVPGEGSESQGSESEGSESQGSESEGSESQGSESKGSESQGSESKENNNGGNNNGLMVKFNYLFSIFLLLLI